MGYYTQYSWSMEPENLSVRDYIKANCDTFYGIDANESNCIEPCKWYDHDKYMRKLSKTFPDVLLILDGKGEEAGDIWRKYYQNGKCQVAKAIITVEDFIPGMLK